MSVDTALDKTDLLIQIFKLNGRKLCESDCNLHINTHSFTVISQAIFEIMTSEHSYLHSLGILVRHFKSSEALKKTMTATEHHHLFSNISVIHKASQGWAYLRSSRLAFLYDVCVKNMENYL